jgi:hypothetical protein
MWKALALIPYISSNSSELNVWFKMWTVEESPPTRKSQSEPQIAMVFVPVP